MKVVNARKQRRQQERQEKKQHKNKRPQQKKSMPTTNGKATNHVAFKGKRKAPPSATDASKRPRMVIQNKFMEMIQAQADEGDNMPLHKSNADAGTISLTTSAKGSTRASKKYRSAEDEALKKLEANLGVTKANGLAKLNKEFENDGLGNDFADFLTSLDDLSKRIKGNEESEESHDSLDSDDDGSESMDDEMQEEMDKLASEDASFLQEDDDLAQYDSDDLSDDDEVAENTKANQLATAIGNGSRGETCDDNPPVDGSLDEQDNDDDEPASSDENTTVSAEEDIYGRPKAPPVSACTAQEIARIDGFALLGVGSSGSSRYVPPHLRLASSNNENLLREIRRRVNGQLNRLSESNMESIAMEFESIYRSHVRADVNRVLLEALLASCCHENFVQLFHKKLETLRATTPSNMDEVPSKETSNLLLFITSLYGFETVHCTLVYDIFRYLSDRYVDRSFFHVEKMKASASFQPMDVELLHLLLQHCGPSLRADDSSALSEMITIIQAKAATHEDKRVQFLLDLISNLKKQKAKAKGTSALSSDRFLQLRKWIGRVKSRVGHSNNALRVAFSELLAADAQGRWWIIGGTWVPPVPKKNESSRTNNVRRSIFCAIMGASDFIEAYDAVVKLGLKDKQEREIIRVILHCCGSEAKYNPFYALLASKFALSDTRYKFTLQLAFWDVFKQMAEWKPRQVFNMGCLLASLLESDAMSLTCLKVVLDFTDLSPAAILFLKVVFEKLLSADDEAAVIGVFERMALHKVKVPGLRDGITVFVHQHMMPYKFKNPLGKVRAKMVAALLDVVGKNTIGPVPNCATAAFWAMATVTIKSHVEVQDAAGETMHRRPLRKHQQAVASLASLYANLFNVHEPDILDLRDSGVTDYSHEFLHHDSDSDWVVLEWDDIMHPHASDDSSDGGSISCMNLDTNEVSVVVARLSHPVGLCAMNKTWLAFGQCVASARGRVLTLSAICNVTLAMRCPEPDSEPRVRHLVTTALTSNAVEPTAMSVSESGVLCVGFGTTSSHVSTTTGALSIWIPSRKCTATDVFEYTVAMSIELTTPHSVRDIVGHPSWPFFYFCMADDRAMAHAPALGQVDLRSSHPALLLDTERFIPSMCMAGTTDRLYYCARASSNVNITYAFDICALEPSHGLPRQARATNGLTDTSNCVETNVSHDRSRVEDGQVKKIQVILRSRPLLPHELDRGVRSVVTCQGSNVHVAPVRSYQVPKHYRFDTVYGPDATQQELYQTSILPLIHRVLQGYKCTVCAYGQTGSGKTHSMEGSKAEPGMISQSLSTIFDELRGKLDSRVRMSHVEIYNEELTDLLSTSSQRRRRGERHPQKGCHRDHGRKAARAKLRGLASTTTFEQPSGDVDEIVDNDVDVAKLSIARHPCHGVFVQGLEEITIQSAADAETLLERSFDCRQKAATLCNKVGDTVQPLGRRDQVSHVRRVACVRRLTIPQELESGEPCVSYGQLRLVDLSGSENYDRAGAQKERQQEAANIGHGLLALGRVIRALVEKWPHVPYRESKLTRLLEDSLGGTAMTMLLLAVSPGDEALEETLNTLNYATIAKRVTTRPTKSSSSTKLEKMAGSLPDCKSQPTLSSAPTVISPWQGRVPIRSSKADLKRLIRATDRAIHVPTSEWTENIVHDNERRLTKKASQILSAIFAKFDSKKGGVLYKHDVQKVYHDLFQLPKAAAPHKLLLDDFLAKFEQVLATNPMVARHVFTSQGYTLNMEKARPGTAADPMAVD
ncbi:hypothetical protein DYB32_003840, partial [Aphanomyces invadans]